MSTPTLLAIRIKELREKQNLSRADLAARMGVKAPSVHDWESGDTAPRLDRLSQLAEVLGCTVEDLIGGKQAP